VQFEDKLIQRCLIFIIVLQAVLIFRISQKRFFNFDEFQVLYASAALVKGKALYNNDIGCHFPLVNIIFALMLKAVGFKTVALFAARIVIILTIFGTLYLTYKIAIETLSVESALLAVALTMSSLTFVNKGIEIRHDVFNMFFNIAGVYWLMKYLETNKKVFIIISGMCLGFALASTQKAFIWNVGIIIGLILFILNSNKYKKKILKILWIYSITIFFTLSIVMLSLIIAFNETLDSILEVTILNTYQYLIPNNSLKAQPITPFLYSKTEIFWPLFYNNGPFYITAIISILKGLISKDSKSSLRIIIISWALSGLLFYLYMKRPFYQSLLPTIPAMAILAAMLLGDMKKEIGKSKFGKKNIFIFRFSAIIILISWPIYLTAKTALADNQETAQQMKNVSFCLNNLDAQDKVLCFTQQQIFFDPIFNISGNECGRTIQMIDQDCFEKYMIENKCKLVIYDYRTHVLKKEVKSKIASNYIYLNTGHIFIPGFQLPPDAEIDKYTWTPGVYYSPTLEITINGYKIENNLIKLKQQVNFFKNLTSEPVRLVYIFHPELSQFAHKNTTMLNGALNNVQK